MVKIRVVRDDLTHRWSKQDSNRSFFSDMKENMCTNIIMLIELLRIQCLLIVHVKDIAW